MFLNYSKKRAVFILLIAVFVVLCLIFEIPKLLCCEINTILFSKEFDDPSAYWWFSVLRDKYMPVKEKYKSDIANPSDVIRYHEEQLTQE